jgi:hypothetical protein
MITGTKYYDFDGHPARRDGDRVTMVDPTGKQKYVESMAKFSQLAYPISQAEYETRVAQLRSKRDG